MSDRELLEKAALNAGVALHWINGLPKEITEHWSGNPEEGPQEREWDWNPLTDDGDALRLAVKLRMCVDPWGAGASATVVVNNRALVAEPHYGDDPAAATRRAIVRAAAALAGDTGEAR